MSEQGARMAQMIGDGNQRVRCAIYGRDGAEFRSTTNFLAYFAGDGGVSLQTDDEGMNTEKALYAIAATLAYYPFLDGMALAAIRDAFAAAVDSGVMEAFREAARDGVGRNGVQSSSSS